MISPSIPYNSVLVHHKESGYLLLPTVIPKNKILIIVNNIEPTKIIINIIDIINKFSLIFLFVLNSNNIPIPEPVNKPPSKLPKVIKLDKYNSVKTTLPAQFGIKPIKLAIKYVNIFELKI